jgi:tetratricopeptide (TPR) repeat protein
VYRALDELTGRQVAVKKLGGTLDGDLARARFAREVRFLEAIRSPAVVGYVAHGVDEAEVPWVVTEWLDGEDLAQRQRARPLSGREVKELVAEVARGLDAIHAIGVVHRDVKPSNVFVRPRENGQFRATVIDLGVALSPVEPQLTHHGTIVGTPGYMSPEQIVGTALSAASDQFSLGVMTYELVAGEKPYQGPDALTVVAKIALSEPPRLSSVLPQIPREVDDIVARAMAKEPAHRFPSAGAFAAALASAPAFRTRREPDAADDVATAAVDVGSDSATLTAAEQRVVTVLFGRFGDVADAAAAASAFDRVARVYGGAPRPLLALARVAVFGGALSTGDEARRVAKAALALVRELPGVELSIATGRTRRAEGLPTDAVERAARSTDRAARGVVVDVPTARLLGDAFDVARVGEELRLIGAREHAAGVRTLLGRTTPCVGRERELSQLEALFDEVEREPVARVAVLTAPAGAGKSRLGQELLQKLRLRVTPPTILVGRASAIAEAAPLGLLGSALKGLARIVDDEPIAARREKLSRIVPASVRGEAATALALVAGIEGAAVSSTEDGQVVGDRLRDAFVEWLAALSTQGAVVWVLEDVQWADPPSITLLDAALKSLADAPIFVVVLARPEVDRRFPGLFDARGAQVFRLTKLTKKASLMLVRHVAGDAVDPALVDRVIERADGNAFYLEELIRAAVESSQHGDEPSVVELPDTVLGMVQARLDALGASGKRLLEVASVFGEIFWPEAVAQASGRPLPAVLTEIDHLVSREVVERRAESRFSGLAELAFRHALVRDAAYELLLDDDRERAHREAARWLAAHGEADHQALARHYELGGERASALPHYARAAEAALVANDFKGATTFAEKALAGTPDDPGRGLLLLLIAEAKRWSGDLRGALAAASRATDLLTAGSSAWFNAMREVVAAHGRLGQMAEIAPIARRIVVIEAAPDAHGARIAGLVVAAVHLVYAGDLAAGRLVAADAERFAARAGVLDPRVKGRLHQMRAVLADRDEAPERGVQEQLEALAAFEAAQDRRAATLVRSNLAFLLAKLGELEQAERLLREALPIAKRLGLGTIAPLVSQNLGVVLAHLGQRDEAMAEQARAAEAFAALGDPRVEATSRVYLGLLHLDRGDLERAEREARTAVDKGEGPLEVGARAALALVHLARGRRAEALDEAKRAVAALERYKVVEEFEELARIALVEALVASGEEAAARAAVETARSRLEARAARLALPAHRSSFWERIPEHRRILELERRLSTSS